MNTRNPFANVRLAGLGLVAALALAPACLHAQTVTATPATLTISYLIGNPLPAAQSVSVRLSTGTATYTATNAQGWLVVSPPAGTLPATLSMQVNPSTLPAGTYTDTVTVTVTGVSTPTTIGVTLIVSAQPSGITASPSTLSFIVPPDPPASQSITLTTTGAPVPFTVTAGAKWMTVSPTAGVVLPGEELVLTISVNATGLAPQTAPYTGKLTIVSSNGGSAQSGTLNLTISLTVNTAAPTITSVFPSTLPVSQNPVTITIRGSGFYSSTVAGLSGLTAPLATKLLSSNALLATIPASELATPTTLNLFVTNPPPGGSSTMFSVPVADTPVLLASVNAASYSTNSTTTTPNVSAGELMTLFGTNIGPVTPADMTTSGPDQVSTSLAGVSVTVDGYAAPLLYVSQNQVSIQTPYEVSTSDSTQQISLVNGTAPAATMPIAIAASSPGIFSSNGTGSGQAAALNYNSTTGQYTLNSQSNPANIGSTVILYITGAGAYPGSTASALGVSSLTGLLLPPTTSPLPQAATTPTVTIGGTAATVSYSGAIPGSLLGLVQLNVTVPTGATTGNAVPVTVTSGSGSAQTTMTLAIHP